MFLYLDSNARAKRYIDEPHMSPSPAPLAPTMIGFRRNG